MLSPSYAFASLANYVPTHSPNYLPNYSPTCVPAPPSDIDASSRFSPGAASASAGEEGEPERKEEKRGLFAGLFGGGKRDRDKDKRDSAAPAEGGAPPSPAPAPATAQPRANIAAPPSPPLPPAPSSLEAGAEEEEGGLVRTSIHATHGTI